MAKNKKSKGGGQPKRLSAEQYIRQNARSLEIGRCFVNSDWQETGCAVVFVERKHKQGNSTVGVYLVDTYCLGVKDTYYMFNALPSEVDEHIEYVCESYNLKEVDYVQAHNIVYGAVAFAEDAGISPCREFDLTTSYILEEDSDDVELIEYEFGKDGKYLLIIDDPVKMSHYNYLLEKNVPGNYEVVFMGDDDDDYDDYELSDRDSEEGYSYEHPEYPAELVLHNEDLYEMLTDKAFVHKAANGGIDELMTLPREELRIDLENIVRYEIGRTYQNLDDCPDGYESPICHALILLGEIADVRSLNVVWEVLHQTIDFVEFHLGIEVDEYLPSAVARIAQYDLNLLSEFLFRQGVPSYNKSTVCSALVYSIYHSDISQEEALKVLKRVFDFFIGNCEDVKYCNSELLGLWVAEVMQLGYDETLSYIRALYETGMVSRSVAGSYSEVEYDFKLRNNVREIELQTTMGIYKMFASWYSNRNI